MATSHAVSEEQVRAQVRTTQIVNGALMLGLLAFLGFVAFARMSPANKGFLGPNPFDVTSALVLAAVAFTAVQVGLSWFVPNVVLAKQQRYALDRPAETGHQVEGGPPAQGAVPGILAAYTTRRIVQLGLLEGAAFLNGVVFMLKGNAIALGLAIGLLALMGVGFPTVERVRAWLDREPEPSRAGR